MFRLYTQDLNRKELLSLITGAGFRGATLIPAIGLWQGEEERSLIIELVDVDRDSAYKLADAIKHWNGQDSVLVVEMPELVSCLV